MHPNWHSGPIPLELGLALLQNPAALEKYTALSRKEKQRFIGEARFPGSREDLEMYVQGLLDWPRQ